MAIFVNTLAGRWTKWKFTKWPIKGKTWRGFEFIANGNSTCLLTSRSWTAIYSYKTYQKNLRYIFNQITFWDVFKIYRKLLREGIVQCSCLLTPRSRSAIKSGMCHGTRGINNLPQTTKIIKRDIVGNILKQWKRNIFLKLPLPNHKDPEWFSLVLTNLGTNITDPFWADCNLGSDEGDFSDEKQMPASVTISKLNCSIF